MTKFNAALVLQHIGVQWRHGQLRRNGKIVKYVTVKKILQQHNPQLTDSEIWQIVFNDISTYAEFRPSLKTISECLRKEGADKRRRLEENKTRRFNNLLRNSHPEDFGLQDYARMPAGHVVAAILAAHPYLKEDQAKKVLGSWILRRL
jgi:hypothetical protein